MICERCTGIGLISEKLQNLSMLSVADISYFSEGQGWTGKTQPGLTHPVKTGLNHTEKPTKVGKIGFLLTFLFVF